MSWRCQSWVKTAPTLHMSIFYSLECHCDLFYFKISKRELIHRGLMEVSSAPCSAGEGPGHHKVLPHVVQARRVGVGAELRHHRAQQPLLQASLHRERQLRPQVSPPPSSGLHFNVTQSCSRLWILDFAPQSAPECKELRLSEDQNRAINPGRGFTAAHDHARHFRGKGVRMKTKLRAAPYPEVGQRDLPPAVLLGPHQQQRPEIFSGVKTSHSPPLDRGDPPKG